MAGGTLCKNSSVYGEDATCIGGSGSAAPTWAFNDELQRPITEGYTYKTGVGPAIQLAEETPLFGTAGAGVGAVTIAMWCRRETINGYHAIWGGPANDSRLYANINSTNLVLSSSVGGPGNTWTSVLPATGTWFHCLFMSYGTQTVELFIDGVSKDPIVIGLPYNFNLEYFGANHVQSFTWSGDLTDCCFWTRRLPLEQIQLVSSKSDSMLDGWIQPTNTATYFVLTSTGPVPSGVEGAGEAESSGIATASTPTTTRKSNIFKSRVIRGIAC